MNNSGMNDAGINNAEINHDRFPPSTAVLVLIGPPAAGKTVVGKRVAKLLRAPFVDTDRRITQRHGAIPQIFVEHGEEWFRAAERREVRQALSEAAVVSLGGGAVLNRDTQLELEQARVVYLSVSSAAVEHRIRGTSRPLLKGGIESWQAIASARRELYERLATRTVDSSHRTAVSIAHELAEWVQQEEDV